MPNKRVSIIGLDGLSWKYLNKLVEKGVIPHIKSIIYKGISSKIYAFPPNTPPSWSSIMTGVNPGKHGIYDFIHFTKNYDQVLVNSNYLEHPRVFEMLGFIGRKSIMINPVPSYPLYKVRNTIQIANSFFVPRVTYYPSKVEKYARKLSYQQPSNDLFSEINKGVTQVGEYLELVEEFIEKEDFDLFWINIPYPDRLLHKTTNKSILEHEIVNGERKLFSTIDKIVDLLDSVSDNVIIVSDHGFSSYDYVIEFNSLLWMKGYVKIKRASEHGLKEHWEFSEFKTEIQGKMVKEIKYDNPLIKLLTSKPLKPIGRIAKSVYEKISGKKIVLKFYEVDHKRSIAFATSNTSLAIIVKSREYIDEVINIVKRVKGVKAVFRREELFEGPYLERLPEIFVVPDFDGGFYMGSNKVSHEIVKKRRILYHHPLGVYIMKQWNYDSEFPDIIPNYLVANIIMNELNVPLSSWADGIDIITKLTGKQPKLTDLYVKRWRLIKKVRSVIS